MIYDFIFRVLTPKELEAIKTNAVLIDKVAARCKKKCNDPFCQIPIPARDNFEVPDYGEVCELCYAMYYAIRNAHLRLGKVDVIIQEDHYGAWPEPPENDK